MFATFPNGELEFVGNEEDRFATSDKLDKLEKGNLIPKTITKINELRTEIENYFEKIE